MSSTLEEYQVLKTAQSNQETQKKAMEYLGRRKGIARRAGGVWQPRQDAEMWGLVCVQWDGDSWVDGMVLWIAVPWLCEAPQAA